ncbi:hypothetical protein Gotri_004982, partial [Gossypium trilobum]|nr:hypothetical protein [Gossypium trilobum]
ARTLKDILFFPFFYHVNPSDVRNLGGRFKTSFDDHELKKLDQVQQWQAVFAEVDDQKKTILRLIDQEGSRIIGLWGMGDIGKTTLADVVYKEASPKFEDHYYFKILEAIKAIQDSESMSSRSTLLRRIHHLLENVGDWIIEYIPREENLEVDRLAKIAYNKEEGLQLFTNNPFHLASVVYLLDKEEGPNKKNEPPYWRDDNQYQYNRGKASTKETDFGNYDTVNRRVIVAGFDCCSSGVNKYGSDKYEHDRRVGLKRHRHVRGLIFHLYEIDKHAY